MPRQYQCKMGWLCFRGESENNQEQGKACEKLSGRSVQHHHRVLAQSLKYAMRQGILGRNPAELVTAPSSRRGVMRILTPSEVEVLFDNAIDDYYYSVTYTAVSTGLRSFGIQGGRLRITAKYSSLF